MTAPLEALRDVDVADVYKSGRLAGSLSRVDDDVVFTYRQDYLGDPTAEPVAFSLPLIALPFRTSGGSVPPFFAGLLPEGLRLNALVTAARTSEDDHLTLLLSVGSDAIGDVQIVPAGATPDVPDAALDDSRDVESFAQLFARATSADPALIERVALPGVQDKISTGVLSTPLATTSGPAILKLGSARYPRIVENEDFFLRMATACGISTAAHEILRDRQGRPGLLVTRFDRVQTTEGMRKLAQEDACQVLGRYPSAKYRIPLEEMIRGLAGAIRQTRGSSPVTIRRALEVAAFSYLIGNGDLHAKNLSILRGSNGTWALSPAYDLLTTQPYLSWKDPMAVPLFGRANRLTRRWWLEAAARLGIPERAMAVRLDAICRAAGPWLDRLPEIGFDDATTRRLRGLLETRTSELGSS